LNDVAPINTAETTNITELTADIVSAYVAKNALSGADLPKLIQEVHAALKGLGSAPAEQPAEELKPAVSIRRSITPDYLVCLDDGLKFKSLKRHLAQLGMTPDQYRAKWGLPADYPMVAPNYSATRSQLARDNGLGRKPQPEAAPAAPPARGRRKAKPATA
jgi:predicted transcriptional regulator